MDVFRQRLEDEYDASVIITAPTVPYKGRYCSLFLVPNNASHTSVIYKDRTVLVSNPTEFPDVTDPNSKVKEVQEPIVNASIIVPDGQSNMKRAGLYAVYNIISWAHRIPWRNDGSMHFPSSREPRPPLS